MNDLVESSMSKYEVSKIDGKEYCRLNGQLTRHLRSNNLTYQQYYEKYITGISPKCSCGKPLTFYQRTMSYASSCGDPKCVGKTIHNVRMGWTDSQRQSDSNNKKIAASKRTREQITDILDKTRKTFKEKYGTDWVTQSSYFKEMSKQTKIDRYGDENYNNRKMISKTNKTKSIEEKNLINQKRRETNLEKYGIENVLMREGVASKSARSNGVGKLFNLPSGKYIHLRGYENIVIMKLLESMSEEAIVVDDMLTDYALPVFKYVNVNNHKLNYYPDIYIPKENKIIEVKSRWWWDGNGAEKYKTRLVNNLRKRQVVLDAGYKYEVWLFDDKYTYEILK